MGEPVVFLPGKIIDLVVKNIDHIRIYHRWVNDPVVRTYIGVDLPEALEVLKKEWFPDERDEKSVWFEIWHKKDKKPIGLVGLFKISHTHRSAELGIFIGEPEYWGQSIGPEAAKLMIEYGFDTLNFHKIVANVNVPNTRSLKMCEKLGFIEEGHQKEMEFVNGEWHDIKWFGIFKENRKTE